MARKHAKSDAVVSSVQRYFAVNWPWTKPEELEKYTKQDIELFTTLAMPDARDDRIELTTVALNVAFLIDDILDYWSHEQVCVTLLMLVYLIKLD